MGDRIRYTKTHGRAALCCTGHAIEIHTAPYPLRTAMNNCTLLVEVVQAPQIRYTNDQVPIAEMIVQFNTPRDNDPPATLKLSAWNRLATEVEQQGYRIGDRLLVEGRLSMVTIDRQEGFREKRAELRAQRIHSLAALGAGAPAYVPPVTPSAPPAPQYAPQQYAPPVPPAPPSNVTPFPSPATPPVNPPSVPGAPPASPSFDEDDIPF